jgi:hypothetical protein
MPCIEVACIGLDTPVQVGATGFLVAAEAGLEPNRVPSRFQVDFDELDGCLYRLGSTSSRERNRGGSLVAYELLSDDSRDRFPASFLAFAPQHVAEMRVVLASILALSPVGRALFTSDWQYGPEWAYRFGPVTLDEFWRLHESRALYLNTAYSLVAAPPDQNRLRPSSIGVG